MSNSRDPIKDPSMVKMLKAIRAHLKRDPNVYIHVMARTYALAGRIGHELREYRDRYRVYAPKNYRAIIGARPLYVDPKVYETHAPIWMSLEQAAHFYRELVIRDSWLKQRMKTADEDTK